MYFIRYQPLKDQLRARTLSDREALPYLIVFAALTALSCALPLVDEYNAWDGVMAVIDVVTAVGGIMYAYYQNGGSRGYDLIQKYVVLGWVVSVRFLLAAIPIMFLVLGLGSFLEIISFDDETGPLGVVVSTLFTIVLYQRIGRHLRDTAQGVTEQGGAHVQ